MTYPGAVTLILKRGWKGDNETLELLDVYEQTGEDRSEVDVIVLAKMLLEYYDAKVKWDD